MPTVPDVIEPVSAQSIAVFLGHNNEDSEASDRRLESRRKQEDGVSLMKTGHIVGTKTSGWTPTKRESSLNLNGITFDCQMTDLPQRLGLKTGPSTPKEPLVTRIRIHDPSQRKADGELAGAYQKKDPQHSPGLDLGIPHAFTTEGGFGNCGVYKWPIRRLVVLKVRSPLEGLEEGEFPTTVLLPLHGQWETLPH